jgi:uncharacterized peroxidase-related enzyme
MTVDTPVHRFELHDAETAPEASRPILGEAARKYGFVPNLLRVLANSPVALRAYATLGGILDDGTLTPAERQVVLLTISVVNRCRYCVGAHSALARRAGVAEDVVEAIREERPLPDARLAALSTVARRLVAQRGWLDEGAVQGFLDSGFDPAQLLEVITALAMKTLSNYTNHLAETPLDVAFRETAWTPREET